MEHGKINNKVMKKCRNKQNFSHKNEKTGQKSMQAKNSKF